MNSFLQKVLSVITGLILAGIFIQPAFAQPQQFQVGLELYQDGDYERAVSALSELQDPRAYLFAGKSFYAMGQYQQAQSNLNNILPDAPPAIYFESVYTSALVDFQLKQFDDALSKLHQVLGKENIDNTLTLDANKLYGEILNYLTADQRLEIIQKVSANQVRFDLLESAMGKVTYSKANQIFNTYESAVDDDEWINKAEDIESLLSSESNYTGEYGRSLEKLRPPEGTIYNIGIALPEYKTGDREFEIVKSIYLGASLARETFNEDHSDVKVSMHFIDTGTETNGLRSSVEQFSKNHQGDALIGPLFSEQAEPMIPLATDFKIPTIAPLANSQINTANSYLFQSNPTFRMHGREMARYAVQELDLQHFAIIARRGTSGASSAEAFRDEAEKLGGQIIHYFVEDLRPNELAVSQYTQYFGSEGDPVEAVYAPFTGDAAITLIDLLLVDLRQMTTSPVALGSQEWQRLNYSSNKYNRLNIFYSQGQYLDGRGARLTRFRSDYRRKFDTSPNQFAMMGYDVATYLLNGLDEAGNPALLKSTLLDMPMYRGLVNDIHFDGGNTNKALKIIEVSPEGDINVRQ